ncbi:hypothetical protein ACU4GD_20400 [Cupriavidus basilensis]
MKVETMTGDGTRLTGPVLRGRHAARLRRLLPERQPQQAVHRRRHEDEAKA